MVVVRRSPPSQIEVDIYPLILAHVTPRVYSWFCTHPEVRSIASAYLRAGVLDADIVEVCPASCSQ
jgi:hypothetical protein